MYEFVAPYAVAVIGPWQTNKLGGVQVISSRINPVDTAEITLPAEGVALDAISKGMPVQIALGYRGKGLWPVFSGKVADVSCSRILTLYCRDSTEDLRQTTITKSFVDAVPQEIIKYALEAAKVSEYTLSSQILPRRHHFIARSLTVLQLIKMVNRTWNLPEWCYYFEPDGQFYWGPWEESSRYNGGQPVATLEYGKNLLDLTPSDNEMGTLKTFSLPFIRHSHLLLLRDRRFWEKEVLTRIERITYNHGEKATEMTVQWRILPS